MCLYEKVIPNGRYEATIKNGGVIPKCNDYRQLTIKIGCGWCEECRKKIANDWKVRLNEEIKDNNACEGVTLSFSPESINRLETEIYTKKYRGIEPSEDGEIQLDVNILAAYAVRMWSERWRKYFKNAPRHWLVTELGHRNSERIHLHGLVWHNFNDKQTFLTMLNKTWKYGNVELGQWVDGRTINYLCKYVTKLDEFHKEYKQRCFVSKGIGKCYTEKFKNWHKFNGKNTITYYKSEKGYKYGLPRYWKLKLWNEEEREKLWSIQLDRERTYLGKEEFNTERQDKEYIDNYKCKLEGLRCTSKSAGYGDNMTGTKRYIITDLMKLNYDKAINYNKQKLVKCVAKRQLVKITPYKEEHEHIGKHIGVDTAHWGLIEGNLTNGDREYNRLLMEAEKYQCSIKKIRLAEAGIIPYPNVKNFVDKK